MKIPGRTPLTLPDDINPPALAAWMVDLIDKSPDRLALIYVSLRDEAGADRAEGDINSALDIARAQGRDLGVQVLPAALGRDLNAGVVAVHEHEFVGGHCVRGCSETRSPE